MVAKLRDVLESECRRRLAAVLQALDQRGDARPLAGRVSPRSGGRGGMKSEEAKRLKALAGENRRARTGG